MKMHPYQILFILFVLTLLMLTVHAQEPIMLIVDSVSGTVNVSDPCSAERDSVVYAAIQAAVNCAQPGDLIVIGAGTYFENIVVDKDLIFQGIGPANTIIDGGITGRVFTVNNEMTATLMDLTVTGGVADSGGGIYTDGGSLIIQGSIVANNTAVSAGGGVYAYSGNVTITDSTISNNQVSVFSNNDALADAAGGGLYIHSGTVTINNSIIMGNRASADTCNATPANAYGGGIYTQTGSVTINDTTISGNVAEATSCNPDVTATASGDGIYAFTGSVIIGGGSIDDETATGDGGSITVGDVAIQPTENAQVLEATEMVELAEVAVTATPVPSSPIPILTATPINVTATAQVNNDDAQVAVRWMQRLMETVRDEQLSPPIASRIYAYTGIALYEAVVPSMPQNRSLSGQLHAMPQMPRTDASLTYDWPLVANSALAAVASGLFQNTSETALQRFAALRDAIELERGEIVPVNVFNRSREQGEALAGVVLQWATADNYAATRELSYTLPTGNPAFWVPLDGQRPLEPFWGNLRTFALPLVSSCDVPLNIEFSTDAASEFYAQADEVRAVGASLTPEQQAIALFWADQPGETATPPGHWVSIENKMVDQLGLSLGRAAEMYALTGIVLADSFISAWEVKYRVQLIRPITYIDAYIDANWKPLINTPPFPEYPSGHSAASGAAATVLTDLFGEVAFSDNTHLTRMLPQRSFTSFQQAAEEAAMSRLYGGIHYRVSIENGLAQGRCVGQNTMDRIQLGG
jgi:PAP2 superfamily protein